MFGLETDLLNMFNAFEQDNMFKNSQVNSLLDVERANDQPGAMAQSQDLSPFNGTF